MEQENFGKLIKDIRKKHNLTQQEFANKYGVTYQAVSKWENGKNLPDTLLMKQISDDFSIKLEDMFKGEYEKKKKNIKLILCISILIVIFIFFIIFLIRYNSEFEFKTLTSQCDNFNIYGNIAYNHKKSSISISNINYCGLPNLTKYKKIECNLYEKNKDTSKLISTCDTKENESMTLDEYLQDISFHVDNYSRVCKDYSNDTLFLEINATNENDIITTYKIPLSLNNNCNN